MASLRSPFLAAVVLGVAGAGWLAVRAHDPEQELPGKLVLEQKGYVVPTRQVSVSAQVSGTVAEVAIEEGMRVKKGDQLARLEATGYQLAAERAQILVEQAQARLKGLEAGPRKEEVNRAEAALLAEKAQLESLQQELKELQRAKQVTVGSVTEAEMTRARSKVRQSELRLDGLQQDLTLLKAGPRPEQLAEARAAVKLAAVDAARARWRLDLTSIRAPFDGTVLVKRVEVGSLVSPQGLNVPAVVCDLADLGRLEAEVYVQEKDVRRLFAGQRCEIRPEAAPDMLYKGQVVRLLPVADRAKGAIGLRVRIDLPAKDETLRPEMGVLVSFFGKE